MHTSTIATKCAKTHILYNEVFSHAVISTKAKRKKHMILALGSPLTVLSNGALERGDLEVGGGLVTTRILWWLEGTMKCRELHLIVTGNKLKGSSTFFLADI